MASTHPIPLASCHKTCHISYKKVKGSTSEKTRRKTHGKNSRESHLYATQIPHKSIYTRSHSRANKKPNGRPHFQSG